MKIAIIFAAGIASRLQPISNSVHKSLIKFKGLTLIEYIIKQLLVVPDLKKIIVITGYLKDDFNFLSDKYPSLTLINNEHFLDYNSGYALTLVSSYFNGEDDIFIISGDMISTKNNFLTNFTTNMMAAITREHNNNKEDWSYQLNIDGNIIGIVKSKDSNSLLAGEWTYITKQWAKVLGKDLINPQQELVLQTTMVGKYLINSSIKYNYELKPYILAFNSHWDIDNIIDLQRTNNYFK